MFIGEQPGDAEDLAGSPFVGPAGRLFDHALEAVGLARDRVYITNVVKHFKWEPRGKRRIHAKPRISEIAGVAEKPVAQARDARTTLIGRTVHTRTQMSICVCDRGPIKCMSPAAAGAARLALRE